MIAPESVVYDMAHSRSIYVSELKNPPPDRCCYKITHRFPLVTSEPALEFFDEQLAIYLENLKFNIPIGEVFRL